MTTFNSSSFYYNSQTPPQRENFLALIRRHPIIFISVSLGFVIACFAIIVMIFSPKEPQRVPEKAPYLTFENESLIEQSVPTTLTKELFFDLDLLLLRSDELSSAPDSDSDGAHYIASIDKSSYSINHIPSIPDGKIYSMNISISDGRKYTLKLLYNDEYHNEYAVAVLDYTGNSSSFRDYIITFTSPTREYYTNLSATYRPSANSSATTVDYFTGIPLSPLPTAATNWIKSLNLSNTETINDTLPSLR